MDFSSGGWSTFLELSLFGSKIFGGAPYALVFDPGLLNLRSLYICIDSLKFSVTEVRSALESSREEDVFIFFDCTESSIGNSTLESGR